MKLGSAVRFRVSYLQPDVFAPVATVVNVTIFGVKDAISAFRMDSLLREDLRIIALHSSGVSCDWNQL